MHIGWQLAVALVALVGIAALAGLVGEVGTIAATTVAAVRAVVQLGVVALVILVVVRAWWSTALFILVMVGVATWTSARRLTPHRSGLVAGAAILAGAVPVVVVVLTSGTIPFTGIAVVPIAGIIIGGAMSATSLAGRRALDTLATRRGEYEAALSLGLAERDAALLLIRTSAAEALVPAIDQTRTVGLVTLPGAFVGVLLGGGSPVAAGATQLLVLVGLLAAETISSVVTVELVSHSVISRP
ncbi:ABC transporter permease [Pseudonocardia sp. N23]|uniref:ABC transporter permease n=1 Tax=Pseudonocardia sp. N23 TaxID=1987376 RepID=UPI000BFE9C2E|nr:ABC transporter permease [Pseudonocardia sp. N23]GAY13066.1 YbbM seven transmembrane helix protein [Pseudonocardia sp. N23]